MLYWIGIKEEQKRPRIENLLLNTVISLFCSTVNLQLTEPSNAGCVTKSSYFVKSPQRSCSNTLVKINILFLLSEAQISINFCLLFIPVLFMPYKP